MENVIVRPIITERSIENAKLGKFTFMIAKSAHKGEIKKAIQGTFNVHVVGLVTTIVKGRSKRSGKRRIEREVPSWKKAMVQLRSGEKIDAFDITGA